MRILGVDPGLTRLGFGAIESEPNRTVSFVEVGVLRSPTDLPIPERLVLIGNGIADVMDRIAPDALSLERVFARSDVSTIMGTAQISGIVMYHAARRGIPVALHTPSEVKAAVTGYGAADKTQVGAMVARILRLAEVPKPADAADALALAICHAWRGSSTPQPSSAASAPTLTPAQQAWRAAETKSRSRRTLGS
ncbi:MAG TPA: crossover junction endodeoxyribonuclease RuvC [Microbacteriaceae bacterium]|nr:crossover junction endodeoxyribonuclease RuvC [Microbacteriaceae bacterium]